MADIKRAAFADLTQKTYEFELVSPEGESLLIEMRALTVGDVLAVDRANPRPEAPVKEVRPRPDGTGFDILYNYEDATYKRALEEWGSRRMRWLILRSWVMDGLPGDTDDEKVDALATLESWAQAGLWLAVQQLITVAEDSVKRRPFRRT